MDNAFVAEAPTLSVTLTVKLDVAAVVGVPLMTPAALSVNPAGNVPALTDQVNGDVPPETVSVFE
jgi:hypothetical protein